MKVVLILIIVSAVFEPSPVHGQEWQNWMTLSSTYVIFNFGLSGPLGGIEFSSDGSTLYIADQANGPSGAIFSVTVNRNSVTNSIMGFGPPTLVTSAPDIDGGLRVLSSGAIVWVNNSAHTLVQMSATGTVSTQSLAAAGIPGNAGGLEVVPATTTEPGFILVSAFNTGGIWKVTTSSAADGTLILDAGPATLFADQPQGIRGIRYAPSGCTAGSILICHWQQSLVSLLSIDPVTGAPSTASGGVPTLDPLVTGLREAAGLAFDPLTNDLFVSCLQQPQTTPAMYQFTGFPPPGAAVPTGAQWQFNKPASWLDVDGLQATACTPAITNLTAYSCGGGGPSAPAVATINFASDVGPSGGFDVAVSAAPLLPAAGGAAILPDGQMVNLNISVPMLFVNGGVVPRLDPVPWTGIATLLSTNAQVAASVQAFVTDPGTPLGVSFSQGNEFHVAVSGGLASVSGPTGDDMSASVDITSAPTCWSTQGLAFYSTVYPVMHVASNGRVVFGAPNDDYFPTAQAALNEAPFVGLWTDLDPTSAGAITVSNPQPGIVRVEYTAVPYYGQIATVDFFMEFDLGSGIINISGLSGIGNHPQGDNQFLGMSPGGGGYATDPGGINFSPMSASSGIGVAGSVGDMLYDLGPSPLSSIASGLDAIYFVPMNGNYQWFGQ